MKPLDSKATRYWVVVLFFLVSGASGLAYEVIWFRRFAYVWGNSAEAVASVVASFLLGPGLLAPLFGRLADSIRSIGSPAPDAISYDPTTASTHRNDSSPYPSRVGARVEILFTSGVCLRGSLESVSACSGLNP